jgi:hypothetical protein
MSDPNHSHRYDPSRKDRCKRIIRDRICGESEDAIAHTRYTERELREAHDDFVSKCEKENRLMGEW